MDGGELHEAEEANRCIAKRTELIVQLLFMDRTADWHNAPLFRAGLHAASRLASG